MSITIEGDVDAFFDRIEQEQAWYLKQQNHWLEANAKEHERLKHLNPGPEVQPHAIVDLEALEAQGPTDGEIRYQRDKRHNR